MPKLRRSLLDAKFGHAFRKQIPAHLQSQHEVPVNRPVVLLAERLRPAVLLLRQIRLSALRRDKGRTHLRQMTYRRAVR